MEGLLLIALYLVISLACTCFCGSSSPQQTNLAATALVWVQ
jgi:hypothetical protein